MPITTTLNLTVADYNDATHWYWRFTDAKGGFLADQEVQLNPKTPNTRASSTFPAISPFTPHPTAAAKTKRASSAR
jgi:hypothetical protein